MERPTLDRRAVLGALATAGTASLAGCPLANPGDDGTTETVDSSMASELAARFAPTVFFDEHEQWFPTDPRPFTSERDGETIVDGFDALNGYHERDTGDGPPNPTVFYNVVEYEDSPLAVAQFWMYSAFDQFTTNFHWHDWEVLHVFVDTETDEPQLYVASSHSRKVPNNEFLDPDPERVPRILSELGSHSSALSVNDTPDRFQRLADEGELADITNSTIETAEDIAAIPFAYGLPRDEGGRLPYLVPQYEGAPLYEHPDLPAVERGDLVSEALTVRSFEELTSPPSDLPERSTGLVFDHTDREGEADIEYDLVPTDEVEHIAGFTGPQLSFEFAVPEVGEDAVSGHITTTGEPWNQPRYENPAADISEPSHRSALAERYDAVGEAAPVNTVVARIADVVPDGDAPEDDGVTTQSTDVEGVALLESDPEAVPTFRGVAAVTDVESGDHQLTVNRAGTAPHTEKVSVSDEGTPVAAGVDGEIPLVANDRARRVELDPGDTDADLTEVGVEDDFGGRLYESPVDGPTAAYVHDGGAYTTEVRDTDDEVGAFRVNPDPSADGSVRIDRPDTGKRSLATFLATIAAETRDQVSAFADENDLQGRENSIRGLAQSLDAVAGAARRAAEAAEAGNAGNTDQRLETVASRLERAIERLTAASDDLSDPLSAAAESRLEQATRRTAQARAADRL
jgi:hypothetical protein